MLEIFQPENIQGLEINKVNIEVSRRISHITKHSDSKIYKTWLLKIKTLLVFY